MSYQIQSMDEFSDACKEFLENHSIRELLEIVGYAIEDKEIEEQSNKGV